MAPGGDVRRQDSSGGTIGAALAVVGGVVVATGSLLAWVKASVGPQSFSAEGIDGWEGKVTIVAGIVMLAVGARALAGAEGARARLRVSAIVGGLAALGVGVYTAMTATDQIVDSAASQVAGEFGVPVQQARATIEVALDQGLLKLSLQVGLYLVIAGGVLGFVAGIVAALGGEATPARPRQPASGSGLTGWAAPPPTTSNPISRQEGVSVAPRTPPLPPKPGEVPLSTSVWALPPQAPAAGAGGVDVGAEGSDRAEDEEPGAP